MNWDKVRQLLDEPTVERGIYDKVILIDAMNLFFRNFATYHTINKFGAHIGGVGGFLKSLGVLCTHINPTQIYVVFDGDNSSDGRKNLLPEYKSNRRKYVINRTVYDSVEEEQDAKISQIVRLVEYLKVLPVRTMAFDDTEADDIISALSKILTDEHDANVYIISSDKDYIQLLSDKTILYRPMKREYYDGKKVLSEYGVLPENFIFYKMFLGDSSDKIRGVNGLGPKKILKFFPELSERVLDLDEIFNISREKAEDHLIYAMIVREESRLRTTYKVMDLRDPMVSDEERGVLREIITNPPPEARFDLIDKMVNHDELFKIIREHSPWFRDNFGKLDTKNLSDYGQEFQIKVISLIISNKQFLITTSDIISEEFFDSSSAKWIVKTSIEYFDKYNTNPTLDVLGIEMKKISSEPLQVSVKELLRKAYVCDENDLTFVRSEFTLFCKHQMLRRAASTVADLLEVNDFDGIRSVMTSALDAGQDRDLGHSLKNDLEDRYRENTRRVVPTPWEIVNDLLQGGLGDGDLGLIIGGPGAGKSWNLVALSGYAVKMGYNVIHYTLELGEGYVGKRFDAYLTEINVQVLDEYRDRIEGALDELEGGLYIKEYPPRLATLDTISSHIKRCKEDGFDADLVVVDYADLLTTKNRYNERKDKLDDIYTGLKSLAKEHHIPVWSASQANRAGAKDRFIEGDKVAGSYDKLMIADFVMSLSRMAEDKQKGTGRYHVIKSRYGADGGDYNATFDPTIGRIDIFHRDEQPESVEPRNELQVRESPIDSDRDLIRSALNRFETEV